MMFRPNKATGGPDLFDEIQNDLYDAMDLMGAQIADDLAQRLGVPVEYVRGPRGGVIIIRSKAGEYPRRETGELIASLQSRVEVDGETIILEIDSDLLYARYLEDGTERMEPRPAWLPTFEDWIDPVLDACVQAIQGR